MSALVTALITKWLSVA